MSLCDIKIILRKVSNKRRIVQCSETREKKTRMRKNRKKSKRPWRSSCFFFLLNITAFFHICIDPSLNQSFIPAISSCKCRKQQTKKKKEKKCHVVLPPLLEGRGRGLRSNSVWVFALCFFFLSFCLLLLFFVFVEEENDEMQI